MTLILAPTLTLTLTLRYEFQASGDSVKLELKSVSTSGCKGGCMLLDDVAVRPNLCVAASTTNTTTTTTGSHSRVLGRGGERD